MTVTIDNHIDIHRVYSFQIQGWMGDILIHTSETITVISKNQMFLTQPPDSEITITSSPTSYLIPKSFFDIPNPNIAPTEFIIVDLMTQIITESEEPLEELVESQITVTDLGSDVSLLMPDHCDFRRIFTFKMIILTNSEIESITSTITIVTSNSISLNDTYSLPIYLQIEQFSPEVSLDLEEYIVHREECPISQIRLSDVFDTYKQTYLAGSQIAEMMSIEGISLFKFTETNRVRQEHMVYVDMEFQGRYTFNPFYILSVNVSEVVLEPIYTNQIPEFTDQLKDMEIEVENDQQVFRYQLPDI